MAQITQISHCVGLDLNFEVQVAGNSRDESNRQNIMGCNKEHIWLRGSYRVLIQYQFLAKGGT